MAVRCVWTIKQKIVVRNFLLLGHLKLKLMKLKRLKLKLMKPLKLIFFNKSVLGIFIIESSARSAKRRFGFFLYSENFIVLPAVVETVERTSLVCPRVGAFLLRRAQQSPCHIAGDYAVLHVNPRVFRMISLRLNRVHSM